MRISTFLLDVTHRCPFTCEHCAVRRLADIEKFEAQSEAMLLCKQHGISVLLSGGEPMILGSDYLAKLVSLRSNFVAMSTTGWGFQEKDVDILIEAGLDALITSTDYTPGVDERTDMGWRVLELFRKRSKTFDLSGIITLAKWSFPYLTGILDRFLDQGIRVDISPLEYAKNQYYYYGAPYEKIAGDLLTVDELKKAREIILSYVDRGLSMVVEQVFRNDTVFQDLAEMKADCGEAPVALTAFPDGRLTLCLRIPGNRVRKYTLKTALENEEQFLEDWRRDKQEMCEGCSWWCGICGGTLTPEEHNYALHVAGKVREGELKQ